MPWAVTIRDMAERGVQPGSGGLHAEAMRSETALRSAEAGYASILMLALTLTTFGRWFDLTLAMVLTSASIVAGLLGIRWGHRASHAARRNSGERVGAYGRLGVVLSIAGILGSSYYSGLLVPALFLLVFVWPVALVGLLLFLAFHSDAKRAERALHGSFSPVAGTSLCMRCGEPSRLRAGTWVRNRWMCPACVRASGGGIP